MASSNSRFPYMFFSSVRSVAILPSRTTLSSVSPICLPRPAQAQPNGTVGLFKLDPDGVGATRVKVGLGRSSVSTIEVTSGLVPGDQVVLSDTSAWDAYDRIRLK